VIVLLCQQPEERELCRFLVEGESTGAVTGLCRQGNQQVGGCATVNLEVQAKDDFGGAPSKLPPDPPSWIARRSF